MKTNSVIFLFLISVVGCASKTPFDMSQDGPTMKQNYEEHMTGVGADIKKEGRAFRINRSLENDINYKAVGEYSYHRLQNPELEMFIYPHRSTRLGVIVPGYSVRFPMYEKVQYGLLRDVSHGQ